MSELGKAENWRSSILGGKLILISEPVLMQILHFNWLRYKRTISTIPRVANSPVFLSFNF